MKKKVVLLVTLALIVVLSCTLFVACNGEAGKSAYELAVEQGFEGSLDEWLESLKGVDGVDGSDGQDGAISVKDLYDSAVEQDGFAGTYSEFLKRYFPANGDVAYASNLALLSAVKVVAKGSAVTTSMWGSSKRDVTSSGSGVIYKINKQSGDAYIITNYHVVYNSGYETKGGISDDVSVYLYGYEDETQAIPAKYIAGGYDYDIAILKVTSSELIKTSDARAVDVANSGDVSVGTTAIAVGCPSSGTNTDFSATKGIVSVDSEIISLADSSIGYSITTRVMRVDTTINSGNSGGGLYDAYGQLIGIVNAKASSTSIDNMGYAIPVDVAVGIANYAIANCDGEDERYIKKLYLGVSGVVDSTKAVYDSATQRVSVVEQISVGAIEDNALVWDYLLVGDILNAVEIDGVRYEITRSFSLPDILWKVTSSTTSITFYVTREGEETSEYIPISADNFITLN